MSRLNTRTAMDSRWPWHHRSVPIGWMNVTVEIFRRLGDAGEYGYDPVTGSLTGPGGEDWPDIALIYRGKARGVQNKDWRARPRTSRGESGTLHAARFQVEERLCPPVHAHDVLRVVSCPADTELLHFVFHVRNPLMSSNMWVRNLLCDVDVAHPQVLPPPNLGIPVRPEDIPAPLTDCTTCGS